MLLAEFIGHCNEAPIALRGLRMPDGDSPIGFGRIGLPYHLISELVFLLYGPMKYRIIFVKKVIDIGLGLKSKRPA